MGYLDLSQNEDIVPAVGLIVHITGSPCQAAACGVLAVGSTATTVVLQCQDTSLSRK